MNPSVAALMRLCDALDTPVGSVIRASAYAQISFGGEKMTEYVLTPRTERRVQALLSEIEPGGGSGPGHYALPTDVEFAFVLDGKLEIDVTGAVDDTLVLGPGDAYTFPGENTHTFRALSDDHPTRVLWVFSPALPTDGNWRTAEEQQS